MSANIDGPVYLYDGKFHAVPQNVADRGSDATTNWIRSQDTAQDPLTLADSVLFGDLVDANIADYRAEAALNTDDNIGEALMALDEFARVDQLTGENFPDDVALTNLREDWKKYRDRYAESRDPSDAAMMVGIEKIAETITGPLVSPIRPRTDVVVAPCT